MEDTNKKEENNTLNLEELSQEELLVKYKELQSNSERGAQKLIKERKAIKEIASDGSKLVEIYDKDPDTAKSILKDMFDGMSIDEYKEKIGIKQEDKSPEQNIEEIVSNMISAEKVKDEINSIVGQLPEDMRAKFKAEFDDITEGKKLTPNNVSKYLEITAKWLKNEDKNVIVPVFGNSAGKSPQSKDVEEEKRKDYAKRILGI